MMRIKQVVVVIGVVALAGYASAKEERGAALFKQHCAVCHPDGGNIINPQKSLFKSMRGANGVTGSEGIVQIMRNPGPGMTRFDGKMISDKDARLIADYIVKTFK